MFFCGQVDCKLRTFWAARSAKCRHSRDVRRGNSGWGSWTSWMFHFQKEISFIIRKKHPPCSFFKWVFQPPTTNMNPFVMRALLRPWFRFCCQVMAPLWLQLGSNGWFNDGWAGKPYWYLWSPGLKILDASLVGCLGSDFWWALVSWAEELKSPQNPPNHRVGVTGRPCFFF